MKIRTFLLSILALLFSITTIASEVSIFARQHWKSRDPNKNGLSKQEKTNKIIVGHTVTDKGDPVLTLQAIQKNQMDNLSLADIGYTMCISERGDIYQCRDKKFTPAILAGNNNNTCAVGIIGRCDEHKDAIKFDNKRIENFAEALARIADEIGFKKLEHKKNIFGMSDLSDRFPISPGKHFMNALPKIIKLANQKLEK